MSAPYVVAHSYGDGYRKFDALAEAIAFALSRPGDVSVRVIGDGYDADGDSEGFHETSDGLGDEERELLEEAGLL